jgi:hypothetical protein
VRARYVVGVALALLGAPVLIDLLARGQRRVFAYFAADAFYYLEVARNWSRHGSFSFDGEHATNGFHPAWQLLLGVVWRVGTAVGVSDTALLIVVALCCLALLGAAILLLAAVILRAHGRLTPWFALLPVGAYALLLLPIWIWARDATENRPDPFEGHLPIYGTLWSYVNGMESALAIFAFALVCFVFVRRRATGRAQAIAVGAVLALLTLSRLDLGAIAAALLVGLVFVAWRRRDAALGRFAACATAATAFPILVYLVGNRWYAGSFLPTSGTLKSTFPRPSLGNARDLRELVSGNTLFAPERVYRQAPVLIGALAAVAAVVWLGRGLLVHDALDLETASARYRLVLLTTGVGVLAIAVYDWFFVPGFDQGHWYWPISTLYVSLVVLEAIGAHAARPASAIGVAVAASVALFLLLGAPADYHRRYSDFYFDEAPEVRDFYGVVRPRLVTFDDGIDAFALDVPSMSGTGLALDRAGIEALERGELLDLAYDRGFDRMSSVVYFDATGLTPSTPPEDVRARVREFLPAQDVERFDFHVEYASRRALSTPAAGNDGRYVVITFAPRS